MSTAEEIAGALKGKKSGKGWVCLCPAHNDKSPSLSVTDEGKRVLLHCHAGCTPDSVMDALVKLGLWHECSNGASNGQWGRDFSAKKRAQTWGPWKWINPPYDYTDAS